MQNTGMTIETEYQRQTEKLALLAQQVQIHKEEQNLAMWEKRVDDLGAELEEYEASCPELREKLKDLQRRYGEQKDLWADRQNKYLDLMEKLNDTKVPADAIAAGKADVRANLTRTVQLQLGVEILELEAIIKSKVPDLQRTKDGLDAAEAQVEDLEGELGQLKEDHRLCATAWGNTWGAVKRNAIQEKDKQIADLTSKLRAAELKSELRGAEITILENEKKALEKQKFKKSKESSRKRARMK